MSTVVYIQGDLIKNPYLVEKIQGKAIIEHTIERLIQLDSTVHIYISLHKNKANIILGYLQQKYSNVHISFSKEQNAGKRMIEVFKYIKPQIIIRVTADQIFLDIEETQAMIYDFANSDLDILYYNLNDGLLPEILSYSALEKCQIQIGKYHRFLKYVGENPHSLNIGRIQHSSETPFFRFYIRNNRELHLARQIKELDLDYTRLNVYGELLFGDTGLYQEGWFDSFVEKQSINDKGETVPWMTYPAIDFLDKRAKGNLTVFEYGCGAGTLWWAKRVESVTACEHNLAWVKKVSRTLPPNAEIIHIDLSKGVDYASQVERTGNKYHIIVIDSRDRINCAKSAVNALLPEGVIIWDDSERVCDDEGKEFILSKGFRKLEFTGMGPIVKDKNETTIFYRDGNCLGI